ncbi:TPA: NAD-dependent malic enzyme [Candidatus Uhrbacteria bacterium]|nr:MAG: Malate dehydrogenase (Oxaloacetate-decarboxylating) [Parcubacteria group bacterium GW2011_GWA2_53_21]OGL71779.1 MAG: malate dehydrogenase [Candidatus Uhrbacteria bacterium RIFCSPHIGHO2_02_FULL_54_11]HBL39518.1 NAD-dependent malic enzyme [Candidatus Uhrbacteria bacterium]
MDIKEQAIEVHRQKRGKLEIASRVPLETKEDLSIAYTPGVAEVCLAIAREPERVWELTMRGRSVAIVTDGSAILGLGNIGPTAGLPVMEGKAVIYKRFADVDAWPICLDTQDVEEIVATVKHLSPTFGAIQLEDISAPRCFEIEERLQRELDIPVFHDDQHATAIVALAALTNALRVVDKKIENVRIVISGAGAAGIAISHLFADAGARSIRVLDSMGVIKSNRPEGSNPYKDRLAKRLEALDPADYGSDLHAVLAGADVFVGVSQPGLLVAEDIKTMNQDAIVFALANPIPEIMPDVAKAGGAAVVASGRSDFPNQINNAVVYPGIFLGALRTRLRNFTSDIKRIVAQTVADLVPEPRADKILPTMFEPNLAEHIAEAMTKHGV